jgi:hypothetical protein
VLFPAYDSDALRVLTPALFEALSTIHRSAPRLSSFWLAQFSSVFLGDGFSEALLLRGYPIMSRSTISLRRSARCAKWRNCPG